MHRHHPHHQHPHLAMFHPRVTPENKPALPRPRTVVATHPGASAGAPVLASPDSVSQDARRPPVRPLATTLPGRDRRLLLEHSAAGHPSTPPVEERGLAIPYAEGQSAESRHPARSGQKDPGGAVSEQPEQQSHGPQVPPGLPEGGAVQREGL